MRARLSFIFGLTAVALMLAPLPADTSVTLVQLSSDPFTNNDSMHKTQV
jgi:hypothetical protein